MKKEKKITLFAHLNHSAKSSGRNLADQTRMLMLYWISTDTLLITASITEGGGQIEEPLFLTDSFKDQVISNQPAMAVCVGGSVC